MLIALTFALAQLAKETHQTMKSYLLDSYRLLTAMEKHNKLDVTTKNLRMLHSLFAGIYHY
jgi:predicted ATPase